MRRDLNRGGFTLPEMLVALLLFGVIAAAIIGVAVRQQRFYHGALEVMGMRQQLHQALAIVPVDLRGVSSIGGDIVALTDSSLDVRATIGSAIVCSHTPNSVTVPPPNARHLTTFLTRARVNDVLLVLDDGTPGNGDDLWRSYTIGSIDSTLSGCPRFTGTALDAGQYSYRYLVTRDLSGTITDGAPLRMLRRVKYSIYRSSDNLWWLGNRECRGDGSQCATVQPVAGPFRPYVANDTANSGVSFVYRDSTGAVTRSATEVARIELFANGQTRGPLSLGSNAIGPFRERVRLSIALRNRR